jgi:hypothetical protein
MKPKIIPMQFRVAARESLTQKIPIKLVPCEVTIEGSHESFQLTNFVRQIRQSTDLVAVFSPKWIMDTQINIILDNKETLEQKIYEIRLIADEPLPTDTIQIFGSKIFTMIGTVWFKNPFNEALSVRTNSKRLRVNNEKLSQQSN